MECDTLWRNLRLVTMADPQDIEPQAGGVIAVCAGRVVWAGAEADAPAFTPAQVIDGEGRLATPALIDCHTHLVHGGSRAAEWQARLAGASYADIARSGGGIVSTTRATRAASEDDLVASALPRLDCLLGEGVGTIEIKSGYGLDPESELRCLRAARRLGALRRVGVVTTFLGLHALPPEFAGRRGDYLDLVCDVMLPAVVGLADAADAFCETIGFTPAEVEHLFTRARALGLPVKLHAEQLSNSHGAALAARHQALSADHLEWLDAEGIAAMAAAGTVAVMLPGAFYATGETRRPPVADLRAAGVPLAVATDSNPGTSPLTSLLLALNMAATLFGLTVPECLAGATVHAARALGLADRGQLVPGAWADFALWDVESPAELIYRMGARPLHARIWRGA